MSANTDELSREIIKRFVEIAEAHECVRLRFCQRKEVGKMLKMVLAGSLVHISVIRGPFSGEPLPVFLRYHDGKLIT